MQRLFFNLFFGTVLLIFTPAICKEFYSLAGELFMSPSFSQFAIGTVLGLGIERYLHRYFPQVAVFEHEITHAIAGLPFGFIPTKIRFSRNRGGYCRHVFYSIGILRFLYPLTQRIVTLAPYFLPTFTVILALFRPLIPATSTAWYYICIGATFGLHAFSCLFDFKDNYTNSKSATFGTGEYTQTDIGKTGMVFSPVFIIVATIMVHSLILVLIVHGYQGIGVWAKEIWTYTITYILPAIAAYLNELT